MTPLVLIGPIEKNMDEESVLQIIHDGAGSQFDPVVVAHFMKYYKKLKLELID